MLELQFRVRIRYLNELRLELGSKLGPKLSFDEI